MAGTEYQKSYCFRKVLERLLGVMGVPEECSCLNELAFHGGAGLLLVYPLRLGSLQLLPLVLLLTAHGGQPS